MSADNWRECPKCGARDEAKRAAARAKVEKSYGKIPRAEWEALNEKAETPIRLKESFREDYEVGVWTRQGEPGPRFHVVYGGRCQTCGFSVEFSASKDIDL